MSQLYYFRSRDWSNQETRPVCSLICQPRILLADQTLIQLLEERHRLAQRLSRRRFALLPRADRPHVVTRQRFVRPRLFLELDHVLRANELSIVAQVLVQPLCRVGQDGRQDRLQVVHSAQDDVNARRGRLPVLLDLEPGRLAIQLAVGLAGQGQCLTQGRAELAGVVQLAHGLEAGLNLLQKRPDLIVQVTRLGHHAVETLVGKAQHAVGQVAPGGNQLVSFVCTQDRVVALDEIFPR